jgi:ABC-type nitrate/sulfonate/bicarbonate transport system permease component
MQSRVRVAVDIGGTFTDIVVMSGDGALHESKVSTTPDEPSRAVVAGVDALLRELDVPASNVEEVLHGTTVGSNTILQRSGARTGLVSTLALPPLSTVAAAWIELLKDGELITNGAASLWRAGAGLFLSIVIGATLGIVMAWWRPVNVLLSPLVEMFYPMPKSALIPVTVIWLGFGNGSKILLIFLGCMIPVTIGAFNGARSSEQTLVWSARSMGANRLRMLWDVVLPSALPELLNGIRTALALAFILLVSSELIVAREGLGYLIGFLGANGSYDAMYAVVLTVAFLGFAADRGYQMLMNRMLQWREQTP